MLLRGGLSRNSRAGSPERLASRHDEDKYLAARSVSAGIIAGARAGVARASGVGRGRSRRVRQFRVCGACGGVAALITFGSYARRVDMEGTVLPSTVVIDDNLAV